MFLSWPKVGPSWPKVGPSFLRWPKAGPSWPEVGPSVFELAQGRAKLARGRAKYYTIQLGLEPRPSKLLHFDVLITLVDLKLTMPQALKVFKRK